jgi:hypothetical protein
LPFAAAAVNFPCMDDQRELPDEGLVPARLVVADEAFDRIAELVKSPPAPTEALRELMRGQGGRARGLSRRRS